MSKQPEQTDARWYVIHTYSGYEHAVKTALLQRIETMNMQDRILMLLFQKKLKLKLRKEKLKS